MNSGARRIGFRTLGDGEPSPSFLGSQPLARGEGSPKARERVAARSGSQHVSAKSRRGLCIRGRLSTLCGDTASWPDGSFSSGTAVGTAQCSLGSGRSSGLPGTCLPGAENSATKEVRLYEVPPVVQREVGEAHRPAGVPSRVRSGLFGPERDSRVGAAGARPSGQGAGAIGNARKRREHSAVESRQR